MEWPSGEATACKAVHTGSIPVSTSDVPRAISSAGERFPDTEEVTGSIPVSRTSVSAFHARFLTQRIKRPGPKGSATAALKALLPHGAMADAEDRRSCH